MEKNRGKRKKLLSAVLCFLMVASLMMPVFAAGIDGAYEESGDKVNEQQELSGGSSGSEDAAIKDGDTEEGKEPPKEEASSGEGTSEEGSSDEATTPEEETSGGGIDSGEGTSGGGINSGEETSGGGINPGEETSGGGITPEGETSGGGITPEGETSGGGITPEGETTDGAITVVDLEACKHVQDLIDALPNPEDVEEPDADLKNQWLIAQMAYNALNAEEQLLVDCTRLKALEEILQPFLLMTLLEVPMPSWEGKGTVEEPYEIKDAGGLQELQTYVNEGNDYSGIYFILTDSISLPDEEWTPIGFMDTDTWNMAWFAGTLDGDSHTIEGLKITEAGACKGLFGLVYGATIKNLTVSGVISQTSPASSEYLGGIVGMGGSTKIEDCTSNVTITITNPQGSVSYIGGIVGEMSESNYGAGEVVGCKNNGDISISGVTAASESIGGIAGRFSGNVEKCENNADISIESSGRMHRVGGILGYIEGYSRTTIADCVNTGDVSRTSARGEGIGGLVGATATPLTIKDSHNTGAIINSATSTSNYTGGLAGNGGSSLIITDSYNEGPVNSKSNYIGGLTGYAGDNPIIKDSYNKGAVTTTDAANTDYVGGVAGCLGTAGGTATPVLENVFNEGSVSVNSTGAASKYTGGVAGYVASGVPDSKDISIKDCYNTGEITGGTYTGGVFGSLGKELGTILRCYNTGAVKVSEHIADGIVLGGVSGEMGDKTALSYCYNTGSIAETAITAGRSIVAVGGITGKNAGASDSFVSSAFNIGRITALNFDNVGGITGANYASNKNVYYSDGIVVGGNTVADADAGGTANVTPEEAGNGKLAYLLDEGAKGYFRTTLWCQGSDGYPVFADSGAQSVYRVKQGSLASGATITISPSEYATPGDFITLTITPPEGQIVFLVTVAGTRGKLDLITIDDTDQSAVKVEFKMPQEDVTVIADFVAAPLEGTHDVIYHANNGLIPEETTMVAITAGKRAPRLTQAQSGFTPPTGERLGYWSITSDGKSEYDFNTAVIGSLDLYAIWRESGKCNVTFNLSGSTASPPAIQPVESGNKATKPSPDPTWESNDPLEKYAFDYWSKEDGTPWNFEEDTVTEDITLYANWKISNIFAMSTPENPAEIADEAGLRLLASLVNSGQLPGPVYIKLTADIPLTGGEWIPIGLKMEHPFRGGFDGGSHTISGLNVIAGGFGGLFGCVKGYEKGDSMEDTVIKNITVEGSIAVPSIPSGAYQFNGGGIAGYADGVIFENCSNEASVTYTSGSTNHVGGIVGVGNNITLKDCKNSGRIGENGYGGYAGGIAGYVSSLKEAAENLSNTGDVGNKNKQYAGGIFGTLSGSYGITKSYNTGNVTAQMGAGGIAAMYGPNASLGMCYNLGNISIYPGSQDPNNVAGGIVGSKSESAKITDCYSMGTLAAIIGPGTSYEAEVTDNVGGVVGKGGVKIENCYFLKNNSDKRTYADEGVTRSISLSQAAFEGGEAAWRLDKGDKGGRTTNWSQLSGAHPIFADGSAKPVYRVSVNGASGGNGSIAPQGRLYHCEGSQVTLSVTPVSGYVLKSLAITDAAGKNYSAQIAGNQASFPMPAANVTVTPAFMEGSLIPEGDVIVTFDLNGGTGSGCEPQTISAGAMAVQPPDPAKADHVFAGWYDSAELGNASGNFLACESFNFNTIILANTTLVACWRSQNAVIVSFDLKMDDGAEGSGPIPPQIVPYGGKITCPAEDPRWNLNSKTFKMEFKGWSAKASGKDDQGQELKWNFDTALSAADYPGGTLTLYAQWKKTLVENPEIEDLATLEELALNIMDYKDANDRAGYYGITFKLSADIPLTSSWRGLGTEDCPFNGTFQGDGHTITLDSDQTQPLFGYVGEDGNVSDVKVEGTLSGSSAAFRGFGGIAGISKGTIADCHVELIIKSNNPVASGVGGIVGGASGGNINNCTLREGSEIRGNKGIGGIAGTADGTEITDCKTEEDVKIIGTRQVGGIVGTLWHIVGLTKIEGCVNNADIGNDAYAASESGGIAGGASYTETGTSLCSMPLTIADCKNHGNIIGNRYVGGIVGRMGSGTDRTIRDCINYGEAILMQSTNAVGGIIGLADRPASGVSNYKIDMQRCENYGTITSKISSARIGGLIGSLMPGIELIGKDCKAGDLAEKTSVTVGAASGAGGSYTVGGLIGGVTLLPSLSTSVLVSDCSFYGSLNGDQTIATNNGALGGVIGGIESSASASETERSVAIDKVSVAATMSGNSAAVGGAIGKLNGTDTKAVYTLKNINVEGDLLKTETTTTAGNGGLGGLIGQMYNFAGKLGISESCWQGNFIDATGLPHGGIIGNMGEITANAKIKIADVYMQGNFSGSGTAAKGGIVGNVKLNAGADVSLESAYWYGNGIVPDSGQAGVIIGKIDGNIDSFEVRNTYYGFSDGIEPVQAEDEEVPLDKDIFKSISAFGSGEVAWLLDGGEGTHNNVWTQDSSLKLPVLDEGSVYRISFTTDDGGASIQPDKVYIKVGEGFQFSASKPSETVTEAGKSYKITYTPVFTVKEGSVAISDGQGSLTASGNGEVTVAFTQTKELIQEEPKPAPKPGKGGEGQGTGNGAGDVGGPGEGPGAGTTDGSGQSEQGTAGSEINNTSGMTSTSEGRTDYLEAEGATSLEEAPPTEEPQDEVLPPVEETPPPLVEEEPEHEGTLSTTQIVMIALGAIGGVAAVGVGVAAALGAFGAAGAGAAGSAGAAGAAGAGAAGAGEAPSGIGRLLKWLRR